ncbi:hypothetical protein [Iningainema tapete]|uniref:hypothetical protein n=1 Tax=Iningainema tapete TaxID=2806730 RepID=UPI001EE23F01|nr:hypothetical protein [Iningainema tapete]
MTVIKALANQYYLYIRRDQKPIPWCSPGWVGEILLTLQLVIAQRAKHSHLRHSFRV